MPVEAACVGGACLRAAGSSAEHGGKLGGHNGIIGVTARQHMALAVVRFKKERGINHKVTQYIERFLSSGFRGGLYPGVF